WSLCYNMTMSFTPGNWIDYELIDVGEGEKLERFGTFVLRRPDVNALDYVSDMKSHHWMSADGVYQSGNSIGQWTFRKVIPSSWIIHYQDLSFKISPTLYKHTGLFPEQASNWDWMRKLIKDAKRPISVLNLFAYTGAASLACAKEGAEVVHVDASKGMVQWAKENAQLSDLSDAKIRYIVDDVLKFVQREIRRGHTYDAIIMDPPTFGRGPKGELWKFDDKLQELIELCKQLLSVKPLFFLVSTYSANFDLHDLKTLMHEQFPLEKAETQCANLILPIKHKNIPLECGNSARVIFK
ncbi:MAG: hypothetical protein FD179_1571, partial [Erysipelotrichaceae bacterium]